ncbi:MAG: (2Fe-2S)-binding protein [Candidatus Eisenbacteria bacterium]|uniref:(2Fe-2S)-binding protein n=1 Tax=Eiseniibacteriota bacterium TaxID=2212470 RepID=A0A538UDA8_UNCEI|nr:MAG: (2Fe-2S)-binding protein [Candidatus Eisenbacteria bacterium]
MPVYNLTVNGQPRTVDAPADMPLLWVLRDLLDVTGPKYGCGVGVCGACTSHLGDSAVRPCITPISAVSEPVTTIDGLEQNGDLHPIQQAWIDLDVASCGYCQPGQIMTALALIVANPNPTDDDIDIAMSQNVCRCGTYAKIRAAIKEAARVMRGGH